MIVHYSFLTLLAEDLAGILVLRVFQACRLVVCTEFWFLNWLRFDNVKCTLPMEGLRLCFQLEIDTPPKTYSVGLWLSLCLGRSCATCSPACSHLDVEFDCQTLRSVDHLPLVHWEDLEVPLEVLLRVLLLQMRVAQRLT